MYNDQTNGIINFADILENQRDRRGDSPFLSWDGYSCTYGEAQAYVKSQADGISKAEIRRTVVAIQVKDPVKQILFFLAVQKAGHIPVLIHEYLHKQELREFLARYQINTVIAEGQEKIFDRRKETSLEEGYFLLQDVGKEEGEFPMAACMGVMTSGSTSVPKLLFRTAESWAGFFPIQDRVFGITPESRIFIQGSFGFTGNLNIALDVLCAGGNVKGTSFLKPSLWEQIIRENGISHIYLIPSKLRILVKRLPSAVLSVVMILSGSQSMNDQLVHSLYRLFPNSEVILYYGSTELNYVSWISGRETLMQPHSVGRIFPGIQAVVKQEEIFVKSPYTVLPAGQFWTSGDMGYFDSRGFLIFQGRKQDIYNIKGNQVSKSKILGIMGQHPCCRDVEIMPFQSDNGETRLEAFIEGEAGSKTEIQRFLETRLHLWEMPVRFFFLSSLPRTSTGKVDYRALRNLQEKGQF